MRFCEFAILSYHMTDRELNTMRNRCLRDDTTEKNR